MTRDLPPPDHSRESLEPALERRSFFRLTAAGPAAIGALSLSPAPAYAQYEGRWDKTFPKSDAVDHRKVTYRNRLGIELIADLYMPRTLDRRTRHPRSSWVTPTAA